MDIEFLHVVSDVEVAPGILYRVNYYVIAIDGQIIKSHTNGYMVILL